MFLPLAAETMPAAWLFICVIKKNYTASQTVCRFRNHV
jgi:hypothetical protein